MAVRLGDSEPKAKAGWTWPSQGRLFALYIGTILALVLGRHYIYESDDPYKCKALMNTGSWHPDGPWLPDGCVSEPFNGRRIQECARGSQIVFAGDESVQGLYWAALSKLGRNIQAERKTGEDLHYKDGTLRVDYVWDPYLNNTSKYIYQDAAKTPILTLIGTGHEFAKLGDIDGFESAIKNVISNPSLTSRTSINHGPHPFDRSDGPGDLMLFAPIAPPLKANPTLAASYISINDRLTQLANHHRFDVFHAFDKMMTGDSTQYDSEKMLTSQSIDLTRLQLLLSLRCNGQRAAVGRPANIRSCCANWARPNWVQNLFLACGLVLLPAIVIFDYFMPILHDEARKITRGTAAFTFGVTVQYLADRTHIFGQVRRLGPHNPTALGMTAIILLSGLLTIRKSKAPKQPPTATKPASQPFLSRDQTEEWKGWMQAFIIMYHYNRGWKIDPLWQVIRIEVASYLFLTGFGHTIYFIQKKDFSFRRVANVMLRTNILPVALAYVMRTGWQLYYYMPLSTFWFLVVYATMAIMPSWNQRTPLLLGKIAVSAASVQGLVYCKTLNRLIFHYLNTIFRMALNPDEFFGHRVKIDSFIVYVGMLLAIFYIWTKDVLTTNKHQDRMACILRDNWTALKYSTIALSATIMAAFFYSTNVFMTSQGQWTDLQPYITFIPILTFAVLRNAHPVLRNFYSAFFAWLGRYSGEMYVMQDHLWLAGDQEAILRTGFFAGDGTVGHDRWRDLVIITPLYLIICSVIGDATGLIATWFIREDKAVSPLPPPVSKQPPIENEVELGLLNNVDGEDGKKLDHDTNEHLEVLEKDSSRRDSMMEVKMIDEESAEEPSRPSRTQAILNVLWRYKVHGRVCILLLCLWAANWFY